MMGGSKAPDVPVLGKAHRISNNPAEVVPGSQVVLLAVPASFHQMYFEAVKPHLSLEDDKPNVRWWNDVCV